MNKENILNMIADIYEDHNICDYSFDSLKLCKEMGYLIIPYDTFPENKIPLLKHFDQDGFSFFNQETKKCEIYYNSNIFPKERLKYTIPHEIYHIEDGHIFSEIVTDEMEKEASEFGNQFHVPEAILIAHNITDSDVIKELFGISKSFANIKESNLRKRIGLYGEELTDSEKRIVNVFDRNRKTIYLNPFDI